jgi:hypothetical protein
MLFVSWIILSLAAGFICTKIVNVLGRIASYDEVFGALEVFEMSHIIAHERSVATYSPPNGKSFDICSELQNLRTQIRENQRSICGEIDSAKMEALLRAVQRLAVAARATSFYAYGCVCQDLADRVADLRFDDSGLGGCLDLLSRWVEHSNQYVRHPSERSAVIALLEQMNHPGWGSPLGQAERGVLYRALLAPDI